MHPPYGGRSNELTNPILYAFNAPYAVNAANDRTVTENTPTPPASMSISVLIRQRSRKLPLSGGPTYRGIANLTYISHKAHSPANSHQKLKLGLFNIRSLLNKASSVRDIICDEDLDIIFLTESWLGTDGAVPLAAACPPNFSYTQSARQGKKGGGLVNIFSDNLKFKTLTLGTYISFEHQATLLLNKSPVLMITLYRPPKSSKTLFLTELSEFLSICSNNYVRTMVAGDVNLHIDNASDTVAVSFLQLLHSFDFIQHIDGPTHKHGHTLDLVFSKGLSITFEKATAKPALSDHFLLNFTMVVSEVGKDK